jgi:hypothetical protein
MVINFRAHKINRATHNLVQKFILINIFIHTHTHTCRVVESHAMNTLIKYIFDLQV